jgi:hypothetical protein
MPQTVNLISKYLDNFVVITCALAISALPACGSTSNSSSFTDARVTSSRSSEVNVEESTVDQLGKLVCDARPSRMGADTEKHTKQSWRCNHKGEAVRIDIYESNQQRTEASQTVLDVYPENENKKALSDLLLICGSKWVMGVDYNEAQDSLVTFLSIIGLKVSTCS